MLIVAFCSLEVSDSNRTNVCSRYAPAMWGMTHWGHPFMFIGAKRKPKHLFCRNFYIGVTTLAIPIFSFSKVEEKLKLQFGQNCAGKPSCLKTKCVCNRKYLVSGLKKKNYTYNAVRINSPVNTLHATQGRAVSLCEFCDTRHCEVHTI